MGPWERAEPQPASQTLRMGCLGGPVEGKAGTVPTLLFPPLSPAMLPPPQPSLPCLSWLRGCRKDGRSGALKSVWPRAPAM